MISIVNGDAYNLLNTLPDNSIDLVYIDISYLIKGMIKSDGTVRELTGFTKEDHNSSKFQTRNNTYKEMVLCQLK